MNDWYDVGVFEEHVARSTSWDVAVEVGDIDDKLVGGRALPSFDKQEWVDCSSRMGLYGSIEG